MRAQKLNLGEGTADDAEDEDAAPDLGAVLSREKSVANTEAVEEVPTPQKNVRNFANSFGRLLLEQRSRWPYYILTVLFAACVGGKFRVSLAYDRRGLIMRLSFYPHHGVSLRADHRRLQLCQRPRQDELREQLLVADVGRIRHRHRSVLLCHGLDVYPRLLREFPPPPPERGPRTVSVPSSNAG